MRSETKPIRKSFSDWISFKKSKGSSPSESKYWNPMLQNLLRQLYLKGPFVVGILRKSANARIVREVQAKLEDNSNYELDDVSVVVVGSVLKELLRSLPNCLLDSRLYNKWMEAVAEDNTLEMRDRIQGLLLKLPSEHMVLLRHLMCVLWHVASRSSDNKMCSMNLAVCIGPSILSPAKGFTAVKREDLSKSVPKVISFLIDHCTELMGESVLNLLGSELEILRPDSGAELGSDSLNSLPDSPVSTSSASGAEELATSSDSGRDEPPTSPSTDFIKSPRKPVPTHLFINKTSLSNLSGDSGLNLSETQLYSPGEEESGSQGEDGVFTLESAPTSSTVGNKDVRTHKHAHMQTRIGSSSPDGNHFSGNSFLRTKSVPHLLSLVPDCIDASPSSSMPYNNIATPYGQNSGTSIYGSCQDHLLKKKKLLPVDRRISSPIVPSNGSSPFSRPPNYQDTTLKQLRDQLMQHQMHYQRLQQQQANLYQQQPQSLHSQTMRNLRSSNPQSFSSLQSSQVSSPYNNTMCLRTKSVPHLLSLDSDCIDASPSSSMPYNNVTMSHGQNSGTSIYGSCPNHLLKKKTLLPVDRRISSPIVLTNGSSSLSSPFSRPPSYQDTTLKQFQNRLMQHQMQQQHRLEQQQQQHRLQQQQANLYQQQPQSLHSQTMRNLRSSNPQSSLQSSQVSSPYNNTTILPYATRYPHGYACSTPVSTHPLGGDQIDGPYNRLRKPKLSLVSPIPQSSISAAYNAISVGSLPQSSHMHRGISVECLVHNNSPIYSCRQIGYV